MKRVVTILVFCLAFRMVGHCQTTLIFGHIINKDKMPIAAACVMVYSQDSTLVSSGVSDASGEFRIEADTVHCDKIRISCIGYETVWKQLPIDGDIELEADVRLLSEVVVKGKRNFTKQTATGFMYDWSGVSFVKNQNLLQAIRLVPFIDVDSEGEISVGGDKRYTMYLNGKPFDMGMANPVKILRSIPAKNVKKIEIVTQPDARFAGQTPVINIITSLNALDGIYLSGAMKYETVPNAKADVSFLAKKEHVDFSFSYDYDYKNQHNQPISQSVTTNGNTTLIDGRGDGKWHTHLLRALTSWRVGSLNVVYADVHAKINNDDYKTRWAEREEMPIETDDGSVKRNENSAIKGTLEANLIYRNYFRRNSNREHFMVGYRYTYNPDKRNYTLSDASGNSGLITQNTNGGINEHTLNLQTIVPVSSQHQLTVGARTIYRKAAINSTDDSGLSYSQNVTYPYLEYTGAFKWFNASVNLSGEYEYMNINSEHGSNVGSTSEHFYFLPSATVYRSFNSWQVYANYSRNLRRPTIVMLNPFYNSENSYFHQVGNPDLKAEIKDALGIGASYFKSRIALSLGLTYTHTADAILYYQREASDLGAIISSYGNIGKLNTLTGNVFVNWQPISAFVVKFNINGGLYHLKSENLDLSQKDYTLNVFGWIDYYLPKDWSVGANMMHFKQAPEPFGTVNSITNYAVHAGKTWLKGALSTSMEIATPFSKYSKLKTTVRNAMFSTKKVNYMNARYVGFNISYTFGRGKKSKLKRDSSLMNADQTSGVQ